MIYCEDGYILFVTLINEVGGSSKGLQAYDGMSQVVFCVKIIVVYHVVIS